MIGNIKRSKKALESKLESSPTTWSHGLVVLVASLWKLPNRYSYRWPIKILGQTWHHQTWQPFVSINSVPFCSKLQRTNVY